MNPNWKGHKIVFMNLDLHHMLRRGIQQEISGWAFQVQYQIFHVDTWTPPKDFHKTTFPY